MTRIAIVGAAGYTGGELIRIVAKHPNLEIGSLASRSQAGKQISEVHEDLFFLQGLEFTSEPKTDVDVVFLCTGHGASAQIIEENPWILERKVIDLSQDFRIKNPDHQFVYGLPELNRGAIKQSGLVANPGCFATAIQLALLPLASGGHLQNEIYVHAITGSTGAGQKPSTTTHFSWRNNNISVYKAFHHQHVAEIRQSLEQLQPNNLPDLHFVPVRGNFTRGILASLHIRTELSEREAQFLFEGFYADHPFAMVVEKNPNVKQVVNTNFGLLHLRKHGEILHVISVLDNLVKGASGQAVQNLNIMQGYSETEGLQLKSVAF